MKHFPLNFSLFILIFCLSTLSSAGQTVLLTVNEDEQILFPESSISINDDRGSIQVCTTDGSGNYYAYTNGSKQGPFRNSDEAFRKINFPEKDDNSGDHKSIENHSGDEKFVTQNETGESFINVGGKTYGPYSVVKELYFSPDGNRFAATTGFITDKEKFIVEYSLLSSECPVIKLKGEPGTIKASETLKTVVVCTEEVIRQDVDMNEVQDYSEKVQLIMKEFEQSKMTPDDINKMSEKMEKLKNPDTSQPQNSFYIYSNTGNILGPLQSCPSEMSLGFGTNSGERWHFFDSGKLNVSGKLVKDFGNDMNINHFWWSKNGNGFAFSTYTELVFSDGKTFPFPLEMKLFEENGKSVMKWIALEENRKFVLYQKAL